MPFGRVTLNSGATIPAIGYGLGTAWFGGKGTVSREHVDGILSAFKAGFRQIDSAEMYANEVSTGAALTECGLPRDQIFLTTKQGPGLNDPRGTFMRQLAELNVKYVDLLLIHDPTSVGKNGGPNLAETWKIYEELYAEGLAKSIGVSNFTLENLQELLKTAKVKPAANQIELHPYVIDIAGPVVDFCHQHGIKIQGFSPQAPVHAKPGGPVDPILERIAQRLEKDTGKKVNVGQVCLLWAKQVGDILVVTSRKPERLNEYIATGDLPDLTPQEIKDITEAGKNLHFRKFMLHAWGEK